MKAIILLFLLTQILSSQESLPQNFRENISIRFIRVYGENSESNPPIIILPTEEQSSVPKICSEKIVIEFDIMALVPPSLFARFYHCSIDWRENDNIFLNDITSNRTSNILWESAPISSKYYSYRGKIIVPNEQVKFNFAGNWKVKLFTYKNPDEPIAQARFFVIKPKLTVEIRFFSNFYLPIYNVTRSAFDIEVIVQNKTKETYIENNVNSVIIYRNNRWNEPFIISSNPKYKEQQKLFRYEFTTSIFGFLQIGKYFRIEGIPAENEYRVLDLTDLRLFPPMSIPLRLPFSDIRRLGSYHEYDDDGAMITNFVSPSYDDYILIEFLLDPDGWISPNEVFLVGSFNNWQANRDWLLQYNENERLYKIRQWVRRARHNYMYATGNLNFDTNTVEKLSFEEYEGNTVTNTHSFIALVYHRNSGFGGFDEIVGIASGSYLTTPYR